MITFDNHALDNRIDERIDDALNFGDVYGGDLFDDDGKVRTLEDMKIGFQPGHLIDIIQRQQEQIKVLENDIMNIRDGMHGLKEINTTLKNLKFVVGQLRRRINT